MIEARAKLTFSKSEAPNDYSPLFISIHMQNVQLLELMADKGANLECVNSQNVHPIFYSINNGKQLSTEYLIFRAHDLNIEDTEC